MRSRDIYIAINHKTYSPWKYCVFAWAFLLKCLNYLRYHQVQAVNLYESGPTVDAV